MPLAPERKRKAAVREKANSKKSDAAEKPSSDKKKKAKTEKVVEDDKPGKDAGCDAKTGAVALDDVPELSAATRKVLTARGITTLFEVQHMSFGSIFAGRDTVGRAKTGCGKTLAFVLPVLERIVTDGLSDGKPGRKPLMLGMAPTRELARQIFNELTSIAEVHGLKAACLYGGAPFGPQVTEVRAGLDAVVATPGRLLDHVKRGTLSLKSLKFVVMDEADEMLSMGFQEDVEAILAEVPASAQKLLFSATLPKWVNNLIDKHLNKDHATVDVVGEGVNNQANTNITHQCIPCSPLTRADTLADLCKVHAGQFGKTLVFTDTKKDCGEMAQHATLVAMGAGVLHGDIPQASREVTMENFRTGKIRLLIATDVAARGLDVPNVDLVVMTRPPQDLDTYVHRSGRTARGGRTGTCVVFYSHREEYLIRLLQKRKGIPLKRRGPPQPSEVVAQAARDCVKQIDFIHQDNVDAFAKVAEELIEERGSPVFLLSAALAAMTGYTARIKCRSLVSAYEGYVSLLLESEREMEAPGKAWYLLRQNVDQELAQACRGMQLVKGRKSAIFDCPQDKVDVVLKSETWKGISFSVAKELPELESASTSLRDDLQEHSENMKRRWERIKGGGKGTKRKLDEDGSSPKGKGKGSGRGGSGRGGGGRGGGKGGGRGGGRGFGQ